MQFLLGVLLSAVCIFFLFSIREVAPGPKATATIWGLKLAAEIIGPLVAIVHASSYGVWKAKQWGWRLALVADLALSGIFIYSLINDGWKNIDWSVVVLAAASMMPLPFLLLPSVRKFCGRRGDSSVVVSG